MAIGERIRSGSSCSKKPLKRARRLSAQKRHDYEEGDLGREVDVLSENPRASTWLGYTGNTLRIVVPDAGEDLRNRLGRVRLEGVSADFIEGHLIRMLD